MDEALLIVRLAVGLTMAAHGAQKLLGWFGGSGHQGTRSFFRRLGYRFSGPLAVAAGLAEAGGGILFAAGLLTPLATLLLAAVLLNAIATVHWRNGFFNGDGGIEYHLVLIAVAVAVPVAGPGAYALDAVLGWEESIAGLAWGFGALAAALIVAFFSVTLGRGEAESVEAPA